jgi:hypothetical protein
MDDTIWNAGYDLADCDVVVPFSDEAKFREAFEDSDEWRSKYNECPSLEIRPAYLTAALHKIVRQGTIIYETREFDVPDKPHQTHHDGQWHNSLCSVEGFAIVHSLLSCAGWHCKSVRTGPLSDVLETDRKYLRLNVWQWHKAVHHKTFAPEVLAAMAANLDHRCAQLRQNFENWQAEESARCSCGSHPDSASKQVRSVHLHDRVASLSVPTLIHHGQRTMDRAALCSARC